MPTLRDERASTSPAIPSLEKPSAEIAGGDEGESVSVAIRTPFIPPFTPVRAKQKQLSKTPRKTKPVKFDKMKAPLFHEIKRLLAVESVAQFANRDLQKQNQIPEAAKYYHGEGAIVSQIHQFIQGSGKYSNLWEMEDTIHGALRVMPEKIHQQISKVFAAGENVTTLLLEGSTLKEGGARISGRTIRTNAQTCTKGAKKMLTLVDEAVKESILEKNGTEYTYQSGKNERDYIDFILYRMYNWSKFNGKSGDVADEETHDDEYDEEVNEESEQLAEPLGELVVPTDDGKGNIGDVVYDSPPEDYLPVGFIYFMTRGPLADKEYRSDILSLDLYLDMKGYSRKDSRKKEAKQKDSDRDYDLGKGNNGRESRGMPLGAGNQKEVAMIAQRQAHARNEAYDSEIVKIDMLIKGKQGRVGTIMDLAKMYRDMGQEEKALELMGNTEVILEEIGSHSKELHTLKSGREDPLEVEEYLKRGRIGMGIRKTPKKKQKTNIGDASKVGNEAAASKGGNGSSSDEFST